MVKRVLQLLKKNPAGLGFEGIRSELRVARKDKAKLLEKLKELEGEGLVRRIKGRFVQAPRTGLVKGRFVTVQRGFGFVAPAAEGLEDIFIPARHSKGALQGDDVEVVYQERGKKGKPEGKIVRILKKARKNVLGIYRERSGLSFILPFDSPAPEEFQLKRGPRLSPKPGMIVEAERDTWRLTAVLGFPDEPGIDTQVVIRKYSLAERFSEAALAEAAAIPGAVPRGEIGKRKDCRGWRTVTIDGENAQDFDDAVSIERLSGGSFLLGVHIADVSHYVRPETALEADAFERATSVYFPDLTLPMLPEKLSNDLCSLRPGVERLTLSALLEIDNHGGIVRSEFHPSVIRTAARMTYASVFKIFEGDAEERRKYAALVPDLLAMRDLARVLREKRMEEGSLDFDLVEPELVYKEGRLASIVPAGRNEAHRLIEEFMVAANVAVASFLARKGVPSLYRVHPAPSVADLEKLRDVLAGFGLVLPPADRIQSKNLGRVLEMVKGRPEEKFIDVQVLRALKLAVYSDENVGHYGLAKTEYTHFTSPIRRWPDLAVHRVLKRALRKEKSEKMPLASWADHASERERNADEAEKDLLEWRIFRFLKNRLGEEFEGTIVDMTKTGLVVELDDFLVEGVIPYRDIGGDYYDRRGEKTLRGRRTGRAFELGGKVRVVLAACDPVLRRMTFVPASGPGETA